MPDAFGIPAQPIPQDPALQAAQTRRADILWAVASIISPEDQLRLGRMSDLAQRGYGVPLLRATELVRVYPGRAQELHDMAKADDPARQVLGAVLDIRGSAMLADGITPSQAALSALRQNRLYILREMAASTATREEEYSILAFRWYQIGCTAIVVAKQPIPHHRELRVARP